MFWEIYLLTRRSLKSIIDVEKKVEKKNYVIDKALKPEKEESDLDRRQFLHYTICDAKYTCS